MAQVPVIQKEKRQPNTIFFKKNIYMQLSLISPLWKAFSPAYWIDKVVTYQ